MPFAPFTPMIKNNFKENIMGNVLVNRESISEIEYAAVDLSIKIERAICIMQDLTEEYFSIDMDNTKAEKELWKLRAGYDEHSIKANIVEDYIFAAKKEVEKIEKMINMLFQPKVESKLEQIIREAEAEGERE